MKRLLQGIAAILIALGFFALSQADLGVPSGFTCTSGTCAIPTGNTLISAPGSISSGTTFTLGTGTGACATSSTLTGGASVGSFLCTGTAGASTIVINLPTAPHGWTCSGGDTTSGVAWAQVIPTATNSCKLTGTITITSDQVNFKALGY